MPGHVDIPRLREGRAGGFFWCAIVLFIHSGRKLITCRSAYVACPKEEKRNEDFIEANWIVRFVNSGTTSMARVDFAKPEIRLNKLISPNS